MEITLAQLPSDIIKAVHNELDFPSQLNIKLISKNFAKYSITNLLDDVPNILLPNIYKILNLYSSVTKLKITISGILRKNIFNTISANLKVLHINGRINNDNISILTNLTELDMSCNNEITDLNRLTNLQILRTSSDNIFSCAIGNNGIKSLTNLTELTIKNTKKITDVNHLVNLLTLDIRYSDSITNNGINKLTNLTSLNIDYNNNISYINNLINLRTLSAIGSYNISNYGISLLTKLTNIRATNIL